MEDRIDSYFKKELSDSGKEQFEQELKTDARLAESVAFYLLAKNAAQQEAFARAGKLEKRHAEWKALHTQKGQSPLRSLSYFAAAAVILIALGLGWYFLKAGVETREEMAAVYVRENFATLNVQMDGHADSLQMAVNEYNNRNYEQSGRLLENILKHDPENAEVLKTAGIVSLRLRHYDQAITHFKKLGNQKELFSNPGRFYEAIAHLQRGLPLDKKEADRLLQEVIDSNLEGKEVAEKWVK